MTIDRTDYCKGCDSKCCRYFTVPLDPPEDQDDFDAMSWYILHEGVSIFIDADGDWYVNMRSRCEALGDDHLCAVYHERPEICRVHNQDVCERNDEDYDFKEHFFTLAELRAYAEKFLARREELRRRRSQAARRAWQRRRASSGDASPAVGEEVTR